MGARFRWYAVASTAATAAMVAYAYNTRQQFYPTVIYLVTSKLSISILGNMALLMVLLFAKLMIKLFLTELSHQEVERVEDNLRFAIPETCLALTIFREQLGVRVVSLFALVLLSKFFHWIMSVRIEQLDVALQVRRRDHVRITVFMSMLMVADAVGASLFVHNVLTHGPSVLILFAFEEILLCISILCTFAKYVLFLINAQVEGRWASRNVWGMYVDVMSELVRLFVYLLYFVIIFTFYGIPLPIIRDLWTSFRRLARRMRDFIEYRRIARTYARFPDATPEELADGVTCIVCRDEMDAAKKLPCGHMFHSVCLRSWLVEQAVCPICRASLTQRPDDAAAPAPPRAEADNAAPAAAAGAPGADAAAADGGDAAAVNAAADAGPVGAQAAGAAGAPPPRRAVPLTQGVMEATFQQMVEEQMNAQLRAAGLAPPQAPVASPAPASVATPATPAAASVASAALGTAASTHTPAVPAAAAAPMASPLTAGSPEALRAAELQYAAAVQQMQWLNMNVAAAPTGQPFGHSPLGMPNAGFAPGAVAWPGTSPSVPTHMPLVGQPAAPVPQPASVSSPAVATAAPVADDAEQRAQLAKTIADLQALQAQVAALTAAAAASSGAQAAASAPPNAQATASPGAQVPVAAAAPALSTPGDGLAVSPAVRDAASGDETSALRQRRLDRFAPVQDAASGDETSTLRQRRLARFAHTQQ